MYIYEGQVRRELPKVGGAPREENPHINYYAVFWVVDFRADLSLSL